jgi:hypothetical protein
MWGVIVMKTRKKRVSGTMMMRRMRMRMMARVTYVLIRSIQTLMMMRI